MDELHAFAGDDRGWHLLAVLERVRRLAGREIQRLGLSATIGNPEALLEWLAPVPDRPRRVIAAAGEGASSAGAHLDYVGSVRTYGFLSCVLPYTYAPWEKRSIFLNFLIPKLPAPAEEDLSKGILDAIDMDSYRVEKRAVQQIMLPDEDAEIDPVPTSGGGHLPERADSGANRSLID